MVIGNPNRDIVVNYAGQVIEKVKEYRYLGLVINDTLTWSNHIQALSRNLSALTGVFRKIANIIPHHLKKSLYNSMFVSNVLYCLPVYGCSTNENIIMLQQIQNRAVKNLYQKDKFYSPRRLLIELQYPSIVNYFRLYAMIHIQSIRHGKIHSNSELIEREHRYETRNKDMIRLLHINSIRWGDNNPLQKAVSYYNELDEVLKSMNNITQFKRCISRMLLEMQSRD